jgi:hypothetical protein
VNNIPPIQKKINTPFQSTLETAFFSSLYNKPACTNELGLLFHLKKLSAINFSYIQHNCPNSIYWFVFDIDRSSAHFDFMELHAPAPNMAVMNKDNGHAHLFYGLEVPVHKNFSSNTAPLKYAADIERALLFTLKSDPGYTNFLCKNPLSPNWITYFYQSYLYTLDWLADYFDLKRFKTSKKNDDQVGLGRNCTLFDTIRAWAYSKIRDKTVNSSISSFQSAVINYTGIVNSQIFAVPLPKQEVKSIGKSIATWTYRHLSEKGFLEYQNRSRIKGRAVAQKKAESRNTKIRSFKRNNLSMSNREIAKIFKVSEYTIRSALKNKNATLF